MQTAVRERSRNAPPLYRQVESYLRQRIASGEIGTGEMLPSVKELCAQFGGLNHLTVRQAIKNLTEENLVRSVQGRGSFVTEHSTRERRIALVLPHLEDTLFIRIAKGAQEVLETSGVKTMILDSRGSENIEADHIGSLQTLPLDGALIFPIADGNIAEQVFRLKLDNFCFVLVDRYFEDIAAPCVVVDNYQGGYDSAQHLVKQKRKRVAWIGETHSTSARLRLKGFQDALNDAGIACPSTLIKDVEVTSDAPVPYHIAQEEIVQNAVAELLAQNPAPDAIVCCDDADALSTLKALQMMKVRVPEEIAVIGFDDIPEAALSTPPLTTIRQPMNNLGKEAATMLLDRMKNKTAPPEKKVLPVELIQRESA
jgi:DNA-binding LacI/PurR family transcriptional regulator